MVNLSLILSCSEREWLWVSGGGWPQGNWAIGANEHMGNPPFALSMLISA
jgi:hypothetical protein